VTQLRDAASADFERLFRVDNLVDEIVDKPPSKPGPGALRLQASTSERFPGGAKPIVECSKRGRRPRAAHLAGRRALFGMS
jgi:hypothetical protein